MVEKKISTVYVKPPYQNRRIGTKLLEECFEWLGTKRPLITIADSELKQFAKVVKKYDWAETQVLADDRLCEHVFNGQPPK